MSRPIYLDYQATTPLAPEAQAAMEPWLGDGFGNPHSSHRMGREAAAAVEVARERILGVLASSRSSRAKSRDVDAAPRPSTSSRRDEVHPERLPWQAVEGLDTNGLEDGDLIFTGSATEAANLALKGAAARSYRHKIVTIATEHACVLDTVGWLGTQGFETVVLPVGPDGLVDLDRARDAIDDRTAIVAAMLVNNEIGVIQPVAEIGAMARAAGALFFCDAVQGFGRVPLPQADMIAISAHKIHGPKGIGALWRRKGVEIEPLIHGGGQEAGIRSGTLSPALCAGFGAAAALAADRAEADRLHVKALWQQATRRLAGWTINGATDPRYHGNLNIRAAGIDSARLISEVRGVVFSSGSACASGSGRASHVLRAIGLSDAEARSSIRLGFGRYTSADDLGRALDLILEAAAAQGLKAA